MNNTLVVGRQESVRNASGRDRMQRSTPRYPFGSPRYAACSASTSSTGISTNSS